MLPPLWPYAEARRTNPGLRSIGRVHTQVPYEAPFAQHVDRVPISPNAHNAYYGDEASVGSTRSIAAHYTPPPPAHTTPHSPALTLGLLCIFSSEFGGTRAQSLHYHTTTLHTYYDYSTFSSFVSEISKTTITLGFLPSFDE